MQVPEINTRKNTAYKPRTKGVLRKIVRYRFVYLLVLPGFLFLLIFKFVPMWGLLLSFQEYNPFQGIFGSEWVGLKNYIDLFTSAEFYMMFRNTLLINIFSLVFFFPIPILLAVMLNEVRHEVFKRVNQSIVYLPHFLSWVVVVSMTYFMLSADVGVLNKLLNEFNIEQVALLSEPKLFWILLTLQSIWKDAGWGTIIFLAAIAGVDPQRYEAAVMDGASRLRQIWHITLPAIRPTIVILLILRLGNMMDIGFEQVLLMYSPVLRDVAEVFDTYAYTQGILRGQISVGITVGMFKGVVGLILVVSANRIVKKFGYEGLY